MRFSEMIIGPLVYKHSKFNLEFIALLFRRQSLHPGFIYPVHMKQSEVYTSKYHQLLNNWKLYENLIFSSFLSTKDDNSILKILDCLL